MVEDLDVNADAVFRWGGFWEMERVTIDDGTLWPNPWGEKYHDIAWRMRHAPECVSKSDLMCAASVMEAYAYLVGEKTLTLESARKKIRGIRSAIGR